MKKFISFSLLILFLYNTIGCYFVFKIMQFTIHEKIEAQIKKNIQENELEIIPFEKVYLINWEEEGKEFKYKNKMYDVVRITTKGDSIYYHCINDKKEEKLLENVEEFVKGDFHGSKKLKSILNSIFKNYYFDKIELNLLAYNEEEILSLYIFIYKDIFTKVLTPPPKTT